MAYRPYQRVRHARLSAVEYTARDGASRVVPSYEVTVYVSDLGRGRFACHTRRVELRDGCEVSFLVRERFGDDADMLLSDGLRFAAGCQERRCSLPFRFVDDDEGVRDVSLQHS